MATKITAALAAAIDAAATNASTTAFATEAGAGTTTEIRTGLQVLLGLGATLAAIWLVVQDELGGYLSPEAQALAGAIVAGTIAVSTTLARVMAIPAVNDWLTRIGLGAEPKADTGYQGQRYTDNPAAELAAQVKDVRGWSVDDADAYDE